MDAAVIEKEALGLSESERALLADRLLQTIGAEDESRHQRWAEEAEDRWQAVQAGELTADGGDSVLKRLRSGLAK